MSLIKQLASEIGPSTNPDFPQFPGDLTLTEEEWHRPLEVKPGSTYLQTVRETLAKLREIPPERRVNYATTPRLKEVWEYMSAFHYNQARAIFENDYTLLFELRREADKTFKKQTNQ